MGSVIYKLQAKSKERAVKIAKAVCAKDPTARLLSLTGRYGDVKFKMSSQLSDLEILFLAARI